LVNDDAPVEPHDGIRAFEEAYAYGVGAYLTDIENGFTFAGGKDFFYQAFGLVIRINQQPLAVEEGAEEKQHRKR